MALLTFKLRNTRKIIATVVRDLSPIVSVVWFLCRVDLVRLSLKVSSFDVFVFAKLNYPKVQKLHVVLIVFSLHSSHQSPLLNFTAKKKTQKLINISPKTLLEFLSLKVSFCFHSLPFGKFIFPSHFHDLHTEKKIIFALIVRRPFRVKVAFTIPNGNFLTLLAYPNVMPQKQMKSN